MATAFAQVPFFALRTALESYDTFTAWGRLPEGMAHEEQVAELRARLRAMVTRPEIEEALLLASPDLAEAIPHWLREPSSARGRRIASSITSISGPTPAITAFATMAEIC